MYARNKPFHKDYLEYAFTYGQAPNRKDEHIFLFGMLVASCNVTCLARKHFGNVGKDKITEFGKPIEKWITDMTKEQT